MTEDDIVIETLSSTMVPRPYNDLGFSVRGRMIILIEAQSIWSENILLRVLIYLTSTYRDMIERLEIDLHSRTKVFLPRPELYVVYTGSEKHTEEMLSLADCFFGGDRTYLDLCVKVLYSDGSDILSQYITFTDILRQQRQDLGSTVEAVIKTVNYPVRTLRTSPFGRGF